MATRMDICTPRKNGDKTFWIKIGSAWIKDGKTQLVFDALPIPDAEGRCVANLFEPKPRDGGQQRQQPSGNNRADDLDDDIPF